MSVRLGPETTWLIGALALAKGITKTAVVRDAVKVYARQNSTELNNFSSAIQNGGRP